MCSFVFGLVEHRLFGLSTRPSSQRGLLSRTLSRTQNFSQRLAFTSNPRGHSQHRNASGLHCSSGFRAASETAAAFPPGRVHRKSLL